MTLKIQIMLLALAALQITHPQFPSLDLHMNLYVPVSVNEHHGYGNREKPDSEMGREFGYAHYVKTRQTQRPTRLKAQQQSMLNTTFILYITKAPMVIYHVLEVLIISLSIIDQISDNLNMKHFNYS
jgi:hypothetical protein